MHERTLLLAAVVACSSISNEDAATHDERVTVLSQNLHLGADIGPIVSAPRDADVPPAVAAAWAQMRRSDVEGRARAIAATIERADPAVIGLQEAALLRRFPHAGGDPEEIDHLAILLRSLEARGLRYRVAMLQTETDVTVPMLAGVDAAGAALLDDVRMIDRDAILVREGVVTSAPRGARYALGLPLELGDERLEIVRGWASVVVHTDAGAFRFFATHLERHAREIRAAQVQELLAITRDESLPVVIAGDFEAPPTGTRAVAAPAGLVTAIRISK